MQRAAPDARLLTDSRSEAKFTPQTKGRQARLTAHGRSENLLVLCPKRLLMNKNAIWCACWCFNHWVVSDPMDCSTPGLPVPHHFPVFAQVHVHCIGDAVQPSHPLSPPSPPALNLFQHQGLVQWVGCSHQVAKGLELQHQSFQWIFRVDFLQEWLSQSIWCRRKGKDLKVRKAWSWSCTLALMRAEPQFPHLQNTGSNTLTEWDWEYSTHKHPLSRAVGFSTSFLTRGSHLRTTAD